MPPKSAKQFRAQSSSLFYRILNKLKDCSNIDDQLQLFCSEIALTPQDMTIRSNIRNEIKQAITKYLPNCDISIFGSTISGFGIKGSDLDLLYEPYPDYWNDHSHQLSEKGNIYIPNMLDVYKKNVTTAEFENLVPKAQLIFARKLLGKQKQIFHRPVFIPARVPILQFKLKACPISCDMSVYHRLGVVNTELFQTFAKVDLRVRPLVLILKTWAKFVGLVHLGAFSSYSFTLLVLFFLQSATPYVLPSVDALKSLGTGSRVVGGWECNFCTDVTAMFESSNTQSIDELLEGFFRFYINFDFTHVVSINMGEAVERSSFDNSEEGYQNFKSAAFAVQDPFELDRNVTAFIKAETIQVFKKASRTVLMTYPINKTPLDKEPWGLMCLFTLDMKQQISFIPLPRHFSFPQSYYCFMLAISGRLKEDVLLHEEKWRLFIEQVYWAIFGLLKHGLQIDAEVDDSARLAPVANSDNADNTSNYNDNNSTSSEGEIKDDYNSLTSIDDMEEQAELVISLTGIVCNDVWSKRRKYENAISNTGYFPASQMEVTRVESQVSCSMTTNLDLLLNEPLVFFLKCFVWERSHLVFSLTPSDMDQFGDLRSLARFLRDYLAEKLATLIALPLGGTFEDIFC